jgi:hypothetical protein
MYLLIEWEKCKVLLWSNPKILNLESIYLTYFIANVLFLFKLESFKVT